MRSLLAALRFLTRLPLPADRSTAVGYSTGAAWFWVAGALLGAISIGLNRALLVVFPVLPRLVLIIAVQFLLTGGLHWDGLSDSADGLLGGASAGRRLEIMRDSRIGAFGAMALLLVLLLQLTTLQSLPPLWLPIALGLAPLWGRSGMVLSAWVARPARREGLGAAFIDSTGWGAVLFNVLTAVGLTALLNWRWALLLLALLFVVTLPFDLLCRRLLGGQTGDTLGAVNQLVESAVLLLLLYLMLRLLSHPGDIAWTSWGWSGHWGLR